MKRHSTFQAILVSTICVSLVGTTLLAIPGANAELAVPTAGSSSAPLATEEQYCDSICPSIANSNGQLLGLNGQAGWSSSDDQWCANHNSQTNPAVMASPAPLGATVPNGSCSVSYYPGDTSCAQVSAGFSRCQYKNSQVESYCEAYESAKMAGAGEDLVLMLDIAATATCASACLIEATGIGNTAGTTAMKFCNYAATGAGALELLVTMTQKSSAMGKIADAAMGAAGIGEGLYGLLSSKGKSCRLDRPKESLMAYLDSLLTFIPEAEAVPIIDSFGNAVDSVTGQPLTTVTMDQSGLLKNAQGQFVDGSGQPLSNTSASTATKPSTNKSCTKEACITAATMAALTGVRYYNNGYGKRSKESSCNSIWGLQSSATAVAGGITAAGYNASGGSVAGTSGSSIGPTGTSAGTSAATGLNCMAGGGTVASCAGQSSAATDGGILGNSGLGNAVTPLAQQLANSGLPAALQSGGLGAAMGGAMSGDGALGNALTKIAQAAADNGKELTQVASMGGYGGGGGGGGSTGSDSNGLANLFGNAGGPSAATAPMQVFKGDGEDADDIWHSHSSSNIFQIVSHRIGKVNP